MNKKLILLGALFAVIAVFIFLMVMRNKSQTLTATKYPASNSAIAKYTLTQISQHSSSESCWMIISGNVYDVTSYIPEHPNTQILDGCGKDATTMFDNVSKHMGRATGMLSNYLIGTLSN